MRTAAVPDDSSARAVAQGGEGSSALPRGDRHANDYCQARYSVGARRRSDYCGGKQVPAASIERHGLKIVYLDDDIVVVDKAAGLLSMGSEGEKERTAHRILNEHLKALTNSPAQQAFIVHRLDRETSGLMMFARSRAVQAALQQNWKSVTKKYLAVVEGVPPKTEGTLRDNLEESKSLRMHCVERGGELAITHYRVVRKGRHNSLIELTLETGRKNQIRVQMAGLGHPIVGDRKYGATTDPARRLALHSCELKFRHPVSGISMNFNTRYPPASKKSSRSGAGRRARHRRVLVEGPTLLRHWGARVRLLLIGKVRDR